MPPQPLSNICAFNSRSKHALFRSDCSRAGNQIFGRTWHVTQLVLVSGTTCVNVWCDRSWWQQSRSVSVLHIKVASAKSIEQPVQFSEYGYDEFIPVMKWNSTGWYGLQLIPLWDLQYLHFLPVKHRSRNQKWAITRIWLFRILGSTRVKDALGNRSSPALWILCCLPHLVPADAKRPQVVVRDSTSALWILRCLQHLVPADDKHPPVVVRDSSPTLW